jgi:hypothetical protein
VGDDAALWGDVLGLPIPGRQQLADLSAEVKQSRFFSLVRRCFLAYSALTPLLIVLEDAHWADRSTLALLDEITKNVEGHKLFFAVTFRLEEELTLDMLNRPFLRAYFAGRFIPRPCQRYAHASSGGGQAAAGGGAAFRLA